MLNNINILVEVMIIILLFTVIINIFRYSKLCAWIFFLIIPVVMAPFLIHSQNLDLFRWLKYVSLPIAACLVQYCRQNESFLYKIGDKLLWITLVINILEASIKDYSVGNYLNCVAAILLISTLRVKKRLSVSNDKPFDLEWNIPLLWIVGYTLWNLSFVYSSYHYVFVQNAGILVFALIVGIYNNKLWIQFRTFSIASYFTILRVWHWHFNLPWFNSFSQFSKNDAKWLAFFSLLWSVIYIINFLRELTIINNRNAH